MIKEKRSRKRVERGVGEGGKEGKRVRKMNPNRGMR